MILFNRIFSHRRMILFNRIFSHRRRITHQFLTFLDLTFRQRSGLRFRLRFGLRFRQGFGMRFRLRFGLRFGLIFIHILPRKTRALLYTGSLSTEPSKRKSVVKGTVLAFVLLLSLLALLHRGAFYCVNQFLPR